MYRGCDMVGGGCDPGAVFVSEMSLLASSSADLSPPLRPRVPADFIMCLNAFFIL